MRGPETGLPPAWSSRSPARGSWTAPSLQGNPGSPEGRETRGRGRGAGALLTPSRWALLGLWALPPPALGLVLCLQLRRLPRPQASPPVPPETELGCSTRVDRAREVPARLAPSPLLVSVEWAHSLLFCLCFCHVLIPKGVHRTTPASLSAGFSGPRSCYEFLTTPTISLWDLAGLVPATNFWTSPQHLSAGFSGPRPVTNFWTPPSISLRDLAGLCPALNFFAGELTKGGLHASLLSSYCGRE